jgi:hypothetical protein
MNIIITYIYIFTKFLVFTMFTMNFEQWFNGNVELKYIYIYNILLYFFTVVF